MNIKEDFDVIDRIVLDEYVKNLYGHLIREKAYYQEMLQKKPVDIVAMSTGKRIDMDLQIVDPLIKEIQKANLEDIEKMTGKPFRYLLENKSKELLKKAE